MSKMSLNSTQLDMLTCWQELNYYKTGTTPFTTLPTTPLSKGLNSTLRALLRVECILGLNSRPENANIQISTKDNTNQYINRQSMNARLILVEKKVEQIGKNHLLHCIRVAKRVQNSIILFENRNLTNCESCEIANFYFTNFDWNRSAGIWTK